MKEPAVLFALFAGALAGAEASVDFAKKLRPWDGFGVNYCETHHTRDYTVFPQDYGGFKYLTEAQREQVIDLVFGPDGLKPAIVKAFCDPFHEPVNDDDDPYNMNPGGFDHKTTTTWIRYFARRGLEKTRARGDSLTFLAGLYGPPGWMTKQKVLLGRDLAPGMLPELAEYLAAWVKYLRDVEGLPVKYASPHNEGEARRRWPEDGGDPISHYVADYNMWWPDSQVVDFLKTAREIFDRHGLREIGLGSGEPTTWSQAFLYAQRIREDPAALKNVGLLTSHGFVQKYDSRAIDLLREARRDLHAWTTSYTWGDMSLAILEDARQLIYTVKCNALIPWAAVHHDYESDKLSPPAGFRVSTNANSPIKTNGGKVEITKAYYHFKQISRAGQAGMAVAEAASHDPEIRLIAFASNGTRNRDALIVLNLAKEAKTVKVAVAGTRAAAAAWTTSDAEFGNHNHEPFREFRQSGGTLSFSAPARSSTTFYFGL